MTIEWFYLLIKTEVDRYPFFCSAVLTFLSLRLKEIFLIGCDIHRVVTQYLGSNVQKKYRTDLNISCENKWGTGENNFIRMCTFFPAMKRASVTGIESISDRLKSTHHLSHINFSQNYRLTWAMVLHQSWRRSTELFCGDNRSIIIY